MAELHATPRSIFSWSFDVFDGPEHVTTIDTAWFGERGDFFADGTDWVVRKLGLFSGHFVLETDGRVVAEAQKESAFLRSFEVSYAGEVMKLSAAHALTRRFVLERGGLAGEVAPMSLFSRRLTATFPDDLPLHFRLFLLFLVILLWRRQKSN